MQSHFNITDSALDDRTIVFDNLCGISNIEVPDEYISQYFKVKDQGSSMKCVGFSLSSYSEIVEMMRLGAKDINPLSAQFIYYNSGKPCKNGTSILEALKGLKKYGVCLEELCHVSGGDTSESMQKPTIEAYQDAEQRKIDGYAQVSDNIEALCKAIYKNGAVNVSLKYASSMLNTIEGWMKKPPCTSTILGNHSVLWIGYSKSKRYFVQLNSYGERQGRFGIEFVPFDVLNWKLGKYQYSIDRVFREAWTILDETQIKDHDFHYNNQPKEVIAEPNPINILMQLGSKVVKVNGIEKTLDTAPVSKNNITYVPIRFISENLGCDCKFKMINNVGNIFITDLVTSRRVDLACGQKIGYVNGQEYVLLSAPYIDENSRTLVPLRAVGEMLGCDVVYKKEDKTITIRR